MTTSLRRGPLGLMNRGYGLAVGDGDVEVVDEPLLADFDVPSMLGGAHFTNGMDGVLAGQPVPVEHRTTCKVCPRGVL
jgi:hypothetical protein